MQVNMTNLTALNSMTDILTLNNAYTAGFFGAFILLAVFCVAFFSSKKYPSAQAFTQACFMSTVSCVFLWLLNIVSFYLLGACILATAVLAFALYWKDN